MKSMMHTMRLTAEAQKKNSLARIETIRKNLKRATEREDFLYELDTVLWQAKELEEAVRRYKEADERIDMLDMIELEDD